MKGPAVDNAERWHPDEGLVLTVRTRCVPISTLEDPDRAWLIAALTLQGWTVASIAERLRCSLRLVQQIKAEPMTKIALHALTIARELSAERGAHRIEIRTATVTAAEKDRQIERLTRQRDVLLDRITVITKGATDAA